MRALKLLAGLAATGLLSSPVLAGEQTYKVELNKTEIVRLPGNASAVVIGNPQIADVSVHATDTLFVVGRGFGETNLIVLDSAGRTMMDADIQVISTTPKNGIRLHNAKARETYSCAPYCQPSPVLGDDSEFISKNTAKEKSTDPLTALFRAVNEEFSQNQGSSSSSSSTSSGSNNSFSGGSNSTPN